MLQAEWTEVWSVFCGLWPQFADKLTEEQQAGYYRQLSAYDQKTVEAAMRAFFDEGTSLPKPGPLRDKAKLLKKSAPNRDTSGDTHADTAERDRIEQERAMMREQVSELTDDQIAGHTRMIVAANPHFAWLAKYRAREGNRLGDTLIRSHICDRLADGLSSTDRTARQYKRATTERQSEWQTKAHYESALQYEFAYVTDAMLEAADEAMKLPPKASIGKGESQRDTQGNRKEEVPA